MHNELWEAKSGVLVSVHGSFVRAFSNIQAGSFVSGEGLMGTCAFDCRKKAP
jgi:hypothetical protein